MRRIGRACFALVVSAVGYHGAQSTAVAQQNPSAEQIIKSLTPSVDPLHPWPTARGMRVAPHSGSAKGDQTAVPVVSMMVTFPFDSAELTATAIHSLDDLANALNDPSLNAYRFRIEGHTDTVGAREYNLQLSERRAAAVVDYLAAKGHVDRNRMVAIGMGEDGLLVATPGQTPEPRNRRVSIVNLGS
jgi:outer membrane protein OmpA-like peptidoglycan-associated protein